MVQKHNIRYSPNASRISFGCQADKDIELARLDECITDAEQRGDQTILKIAKQRRKAVSSWVVGTK
jgi:hypothetical protein